VDKSLLLVCSTRILSGIVGLVAGRLTERYYRPAVVVEQGPNESRGSARSIQEFDITAALDEVRYMLVRHGGHSRAAGFTVRTERLSELSAALGEIADRELGALSDLRPSIEIDAEVPVGDVSWLLLEQFARVEPTGQDNPQPALLSRGLRVRECRAVGGGKHLRLVLDGGPHQPVYDAIGFGMGAIAESLGDMARVDIVYTIEANEFSGNRRLQLNLRDLRPAALPGV
jgi:single-stranded-DNA-specific exonuclease